MSNKSKAAMILEAQARKIQIARKQRPEQNSGAVQSQWGKVTSESRLIDNGHYMKSAPAAKLDYLRENIRAQKKARNGKIEIVLVKR